MFDAATVVIGGMGLIAAITVLVLAARGQHRAWKSPCAKRGYDHSN